MTRPRLAQVIWHELDFYRAKPSISERDIEETLNEFERKGQPVLFILDGFDEVASQINSGSEYEYLQHLFTILREQAFWVLTSRPYYVTPSLLEVKWAQDGYKHLENIGFVESDIKQFIQNYVASVSKAEASSEARQTFVTKLERYVLDNPNLKAIASIPINLEWLCAIPEQDRKAGDTLCKVYGKMVQARILSYVRRTYQEDDVLMEQLRFQDKQAEKLKEYQLSIHFLAELGWTLMRVQRLISTEEEYVGKNGLLGVLQDETRGKAAEIALRGLGLVQPVNDGHNTEWTHQSYYFVHLTFQEYFAALHWVERFCSNDFSKKRSAIRDLETFRYHQRFEIVWRFAVGLLATTHGQRHHLVAFWNEFDRLPEEKIGFVEKRFIIGGLGECFEQLPRENRLQWIETLWVWFQSERGDIGFDSLAQLIQQYHQIGQALLPVVIKLMQHEKGEEQRRAHQMACSFGIDIIEFVDVVLRNKNEELCENVALTLGQLLVSNETWGGKQIDALIRVLGNKNYRYDFRDWTRTLERNRHCAYAFRDWKWALERLVSKVNSGGAVIDRCFDTLIRSLGDKNKYVRRDVVQTLGKLPVLNDAAREGKRIDTLIQLLRDEDSGVRECAAWTLCELPALNNTTREDKWIDRLIQALGNEDSNVRKAAAQALGKLPISNDTTREGKRIDRLIQALGDEDSNVREAAAQALGKLPVSNDTTREGKRLDALVEALGDKVHSSCGAARALGELPVSNDAAQEGKRLDALGKLSSIYSVVNHQEIIWTKQHANEPAKIFRISKNPLPSIPIRRM